MRLLSLAASLSAWPALAMGAETASAAARDGAVAVEQAGNPLTPWLVLASVIMMVMLAAAQWLVLRRPRR